MRRLLGSIGYADAVDTLDCLHRPAPTDAAGRQDVVAAVAGAMAGGLLFLLTHRSLIDDAYITLTYARNVAFHLHWGLIEQQTSNTATSPLNVWLLAVVTMLVREPVVAVGVILMVTSAATAVWSARIARQTGVSWIAPVLTVVALLVSPLLGSTIGLETFMAASLVVGLAHYAVLGRPVAAGVISGLLVLTRPDLVVFSVVAVLGVAALRRWMPVVIAVAILVALPWHLISWVLLGSALPDTFLLKTRGGRWDDSYNLATGWQLYGQAYPAATVLAAGPAVLGLLCLLAWGTPALRRAVPNGLAVPVVTGVGGLAHLAAFAALGTSPYHWYYGPSVAGLTCCAAFTAAALLGAAPRSLGVVAAAPLAILAVFSAGFALGRGVPWTVAPITTNWALPGQYARVGADLAANVEDQTISGPGEIGTLVYFCDCPIADAFSDRGVMNAVIRHREREAGPLERRLLQLNYRYLDRDSLPARPDRILRYDGAQRADGPGQWDTVSPWTGPGRLVLVPAR
ncbi:MAG: hypothetical protein M3143_04615 [Actinomycetota bacterium]|nr:hypothetical protein [Actinomycetota bacterium]